MSAIAFTARGLGWAPCSDTVPVVERSLTRVVALLAGDGEGRSSGRSEVTDSTNETGSVTVLVDERRGYGECTALIDVEYCLETEPMRYTVGGN